MSKHHRICDGLNTTSCVVIRNSNESVAQILEYSKGRVVGELVEDVIYFDDQLYSKLVFVNAIEMKDLGGLISDGVFGLGFSSNHSAASHLGYLRQLRDQNKIEHIQFSIYLSNCRNASGTKSELIIGGYDERYFRKDAQLAYFQVVDEERWVIQLYYIKLNNVKIHEEPIRAVVDSGTSYIVMPRSLGDRILIYLSSIQIMCISYSNQHISCNCESGTITQFPSIKLGAYDQNHTFHELLLEPEDYIYRIRNICHLQISPLDFNMVILGNTFMRKYYSIFDEENMRIGFVEAEQTLNLVESMVQKCVYFII